MQLGGHCGKQAMSILFHAENGDTTFCSVDLALPGNIVSKIITIKFT
jgi:hypothetical protein